MKEYELEVLDEYDVEVRSTRRIRGAFFCDTNEGTMLLKETKISARRAPLLYEILNYLEKQEGFRVDTPVFTKSGELLCTGRDGTKYMLKKWFAGRECEVKREADVVEAARHLARLHQSFVWRERNDSVDEENIPFTGRAPEEEALRHNRELKKVRAFIRDRVSKSQFEYLFLENFERMYDLAERVTERLQSGACRGLYSECIEKRALIHGDYNYHNVLMVSYIPAVTNFEHFRIDIQAQDLYYFLRKVMEKHQWNEQLGMRMLNAYEAVRPLNSAEREYIALNLAYPEKFWKTASSYYHSNKAWIPEKSVEKLKLSAQQSEEKLRFIENIFTLNLQVPVV